MPGVEDFGAFDYAPTGLLPIGAGARLAPTVPTPAKCPAIPSTQPAERRHGPARLHVAAESGTVSVFDETDRTLHKVAEAKVAGGAHTVAVDQATHRVWFPLDNVDGHPVLRVMEPTAAGEQPGSGR